MFIETFTKAKYKNTCDEGNLNLLVKPRIFFKFSGKNIILCILKGEMPFKMHKITLFFSRKKRVKKICVPTLLKIVRPITLNTLVFFLFGLNGRECPNAILAICE